MWIFFFHSDKFYYENYVAINDKLAKCVLNHELKKETERPRVNKSGLYAPLPIHTRVSTPYVTRQTMNLKKLPSIDCILLMSPFNKHVFCWELSARDM